VNALTNNLAKVDGKVNNLQTSVNTLEQGWKLQSDGDVATAVKAGPIPLQLTVVPTLMWPAQATPLP
jgi:hypothetical protein